MKLKEEFIAIRWADLGVETVFTELSGKKLKFCGLTTSLLTTSRLCLCSVRAATGDT